MTEQALIALKKSIRHWERICDGKHPKEKMGPRHCALCGQFYALNCIGCPVWEHTRKPACRGTPYDSVDDAMAFATMSVDIDVVGAFQHRPLVHRTCVAELKFLKSLLPKKGGRRA